MNYTGIVSAVDQDGRKARVYISAINLLTGELPVANSICLPQPDETVLVAFTGKGTVDGIIIENLSATPAPPGGTGTTYTHNQIAPAAVWDIEHNLDRYPSVTVVDSAGSEVLGDVQYISANAVRVTFSGAFAGQAYLN